MSAAIGLAGLCLAAVAGLLVAEWRGHAVARAVLKTSASLAFVGLALQMGALASPYGRWVLAGLVLGLVGDVLLLSDRASAFRAGLGAFLLSHLAFAAGFAATGAFSGTGAALAALPMAVVGGVVLRWLRPGLAGADRVAVPAYVVAIGAMVVTAAGRAGATGADSVLVGAVLFAASDLAVARERFVATGFVNKAWGLPTYFVAQLLIASTVAPVA